MDAILATIGWIIFAYILIRLAIGALGMAPLFFRSINPLRGLSAVSEIYPFACPYCQSTSVSWDIHRHQGWLRPDKRIAMACACRHCGVRFTMGRRETDKGIQYELISRYE